MALLNCEICLHEEHRSRIACRFAKWTDYEAHMRSVHNLMVTKDGLHTEPADKKPRPAADEL